jgi:glucose/arabinose dehydrogenase
MEQPDAPLVPVLTGIPKGTIHNGGRLAVGPEGDLWAGTGDVGERSLSQDPASLGGKVLRMTLQGAPVAGAETVVFSRGHRNVQGLAFDAAAAGTPWSSARPLRRGHPRSRQGSNGGWPVVEGDRTTAAAATYAHQTWETSEAFPPPAPRHRGTLYVAALRGQRLLTVPLAARVVRRRCTRASTRLRRLAARRTAPCGSHEQPDGRGDPCTRRPCAARCRWLARHRSPGG